MKNLLILVSIVFAVSIPALPNIANPDLPARRKSVETSLSIRLDRSATEARLIIPRGQVKQLRAELEQLDDPDNTTAAGFTNVQTIISGGLLSLAFVFAGMWFLRSGGRPSRTVAASIAILAVSSVATLVYANAGPPPEARSITGKMFAPAVHQYGSGWGKIKLEVSDTARNPELIVPDPADKPAD